MGGKRPSDGKIRRQQKRRKDCRRRWRNGMTMRRWPPRRSAISRGKRRLRQRRRGRQQGRTDEAGAGCLSRAAHRQTISTILYRAIFCGFRSHTRFLSPCFHLPASVSDRIWAEVVTPAHVHLCFPIGPVLRLHALTVEHSCFCSRRGCGCKRHFALLVAGGWSAVCMLKHLAVRRPCHRCHPQRLGFGGALVRAVSDTTVARSVPAPCNAHATSMCVNNMYAPVA